jgi:hypothetical protein
MTFTLLLILNIMLGLTLLGSLTFAMLLAKKLTPHASGAAEKTSAAPLEARVPRHARATGRHVPAQLQTALD